MIERARLDEAAGIDTPRRQHALGERIAHGVAHAAAGGIEVALAARQPLLDREIGFGVRRRVQAYEGPRGGCERGGSSGAEHA